MLSHMTANENGEQATRPSLKSVPTSVPTGGPQTTPIGLRGNMSEADTTAAIRAERKAAKARQWVRR